MRISVGTTMRTTKLKDKNPVLSQFLFNVKTRIFAQPTSHSAFSEISLAKTKTVVADIFQYYDNYYYIYETYMQTWKIF